MRPSSEAWSATELDGRVQLDPSAAGHDPLHGLTARAARRPILQIGAAIRRSGNSAPRHWQSASPKQPFEPSGSAALCGHDIRIHAGIAQTVSPTRPSPYLLQHKHNPVDWWPWGPEALAEAKRANKPILLSVGYAACHWCHVMAHESFEDEATARVMNELFVNIKVDREERPDIDQIYMAALHHLGEQGGWPLTMFLTPDGEPFWGGTYFPKTSRYGRPAFVDVLREVDAAVLARSPQERRAEPQRADGAARRERPAGRRKVVDRRPANSIARRRQIARHDRSRSMAACAARRSSRNRTMLEFLWRAGLRDRRPALTSRPIELSLDRMCEGGIYDHLGGGFSRYSVDDALAGAAFREDALRQRPAPRAAGARLAALGNCRCSATRARETVAWLGREMTTAGGRVLRLARCRFRGRGGQVLRLVARRDRTQRSARRMLRFSLRTTT